MRGKRIAIWIVLALIGALLVWLALRPQPIAVEVAEVARGTLERTVDEEGRTRARERYVVSAPVAGELQRVELEAGDPVAEGEVVAAIEPASSTPLDPRSRAELEQQLRVAQAAERRAAAARSFASTELARTRELVASGAAARRSLDAAELEAEAAARELEGARATTRAIRVQLGLGKQDGQPPIPVRAPAGGRVLRVLQESASVVAAGTPILAVGDADSLEIVTDVLSEEAVRISPGAKVIIERWGGERELRGRVRRVEPAAYTKVSALGVEEQRVDVVIDFLDPPEERRGLGDGYRVETRIVTWSGDDVIAAPLGALFRQGETWAVFVVDGDRARQRAVRIGHRGAERVEILEGLEAGAQVVLYPGDRIEDGTLVEPR
ncbi:efflux RND transporter periplasmic adaptor subunit [Vulgatibacter sp.]|uniref:efflux RND transporter periplasmic adaptor subunit n=1 Tax=Vulgatibacter sp. TaxID=1971226 RepID=UPI00356AED85